MASSLKYQLTVPLTTYSFIVIIHTIVNFAYFICNLSAVLLYFYSLFIALFAFFFSCFFCCLVLAFCGFCLPLFIIASLNVVRPFVRSSIQNVCVCLAACLSIYVCNLSFSQSVCLYLCTYYIHAYIAYALGLFLESKLI